MPNLALACEALVEMAQLLELAPLPTKSVDAVTTQFCARLHDLLKEYWKAGDSRIDLNATLRGLVEEHVSAAYTEGLLQGGMSAEDFDADTTQAADDLVAEQTSHLDGFITAIQDAKDDKTLRDGVDQRAELWCQSVSAAGMRGLADAKGADMVTWHVGDTEHCATCLKLDGQRHRRKWFADRNYFPQTPGASMDCGGFNCQCILE